MKLNKAIEIIYNHQCDLPREVPDLIDALHLGIHALKRIDECRHDDNLTIIERLPGETKGSMKIEEAIERNTDLCASPHMKGMDKSIDAVQLGIEALKYYQTTNVPPDHPGYVPLPGESEE